jgi:hypothetical protein
MLFLHLGDSESTSWREYQRAVSVRLTDPCLERNLVRLPLLCSVPLDFGVYWFALGEKRIGQRNFS